MSEADEALPSIAYAVPFEPGELRARKILGWAFAGYGAIGAAMAAFQLLVGLGMAPVSTRVTGSLAGAQVPLYLVAILAQSGICVGGLWVLRSGGLGARWLLRSAILVPPVLGVVRLLIQLGTLPGSWTWADRLYLTVPSIVGSSALAAVLFAMTYVVPTRRE